MRIIFRSFIKQQVSRMVNNINDFRTSKISNNI